MSPIPTEIGKWYFGFRCLQCAKPFALFPDEPPGQMEYQHQDGSYDVTCWCGATGDYPAVAIRRFRD